MVAIKQWNSPPLTTRSVSSSSSCVPPACAAYLTNSASAPSGRPLMDIQHGPHSCQIVLGLNHAGQTMKSTSASKYATSVAIASSFDHTSERKVSDSEQIIDYYSPRSSCCEWR